MDLILEMKVMIINILLKNCKWILLCNCKHNDSENNITKKL